MNRLGAYRLVGQLGEGSMGVVYEGVHLAIGRRVAIKVLKAEQARDPQVAARFLREAKAANAVSHPNVVNVYEYGQTPDGSAYLVMELLQGETLAALETRVGRLSLPQIGRIFEQVLSALAEAHPRGVVHRDLKPANIFLVRRGDDPLFVKIVDFGVAKLSSALATQITSTGMVLGTPNYMSPEQILGRPVDGRSDLFSTGVMIYEAATGELPFRAGSLHELMRVIASSDPPSPRQVVPEMPSALEQVIVTSMQKDPAHRYQTAAAMMEAFAAATHRGTGRTLAFVEPLGGGARRRRWPWAVALLLATSAAGAGIYLTRQPAVEKRDGFDATSLLRDAVSAPDAAEAADAVAALAMAGGPQAAPLLYPALEGLPELRRQAAHALEALGLPEAAPRVRAALEASGPRLRVELAAVLAALGDRDAVSILRRGLEEPGARLTAALGLNAAGQTDEARPVLVEIFRSTPRGRSEWRESAAALAALGEFEARDALSAELSQADAERAVLAAARLARLGDAPAKAYLGRVLDDPGFARRGEAALALAKAGDRGALRFVEGGLASKNPEDRRHAAAVAGTLGEASFRPALIRMAREDADRMTRLTAAAALLGLGGS